MLEPLRNRTYRALFGAQVSALLGTGLATIALGLLAHDLAGASAGEILGAALTIKMICYVGVAPVASAMAARLPRKTLLVSLDLVRAGVAVSLPFVTEAWQIYALMSVLYLASAAFTPAFQAMIPEVLPDEADYTKALSLSRIAADLESVASPILAAALLGIMTFHELFVGTSVGFVFSAMLVVSCALPRLQQSVTRPFVQRVTRGLELFRRTPRLRALCAVSVATAATGAMVFVNTVVLVQELLGLGDQETAWALGAFGAGSMLAAFALPPILEKFPGRLVLTSAAGLSAWGLLAGPFLDHSYAALLVLWTFLGCCYSVTLTPVGRVLRRSSQAEDRPALFAAQFALSHACWLIAYPVAGFVGARWDVEDAFFPLAILAFVGTIAASALWPADDPQQIEHSHAELAPDHPHLADGSSPHIHDFVIDDLHQDWPRS